LDVFLLKCSLTSLGFLVTAAELEQNSIRIEYLGALGKSSRHQLQLVLQILGKPTDEDISGMSNPKFYDLLRAMDPREPVI
jgi:hypothetical protein